jgi:hypothetical protein
MDCDSIPPAKLGVGGFLRTRDTYIRTNLIFQEMSEFSLLRVLISDNKSINDSQFVAILYLSS